VKETWEVRVWHDNVPASDHCIARGRRMGTVTQLFLDRSDECLHDLIDLHSARKQLGKTGAISYSAIKRRYSAREIADSSLFRVLWTKMFEPAGEDCGTDYDLSNACPVCSAGRQVLGRLRLDSRTLPNAADAAFTIARDERVVNERLADVIRAEHFTGVELVEIETFPARKATSPWFQLVVTGPELAFVPPTRFANSPIDSRNEFACPRGHTLGHSLVTEAFVAPSSGQATDVMHSLQFEGSPSGLIVPWRTLFVSPRFRAAMVKHKIRGWQYEVAYYQ
jgi:hypothetical protein